MTDRQQTHPQYKSDRATVDTLLSRQQPDDLDLAELARLKIRYKGFPGASDIQKDLDQILQKWNYNEETLFDKTREIHAKGQVYRSKKSDREDWV